MLFRNLLRKNHRSLVPGLRNYLMKQKQWRNAITKKQQSFPGKTAENIVKTDLSHPIAGWFFLCDNGNAAACPDCCREGGSLEGRHYAGYAGKTGQYRYFRGKAQAGSTCRTGGRIGGEVKNGK